MPFPPIEPVRFGAPWSVAAGTAMFALGWVFPHFLDSDSNLVYLYAATTGLIPCPTLSIVIGLALILNGVGSREWSSLIVATWLFYGAFGAARLGVRMDLVLVAGSVILAAAAVVPTRTIAG